MATEYKTNWDASWVDILNTDVPAIINDIKFEVWESKLEIPSSNGESFPIKGQEFIKIIITCDDKEFFVKALKGITLGNNFPNILQLFIQQNLGHMVNRKYIA